MMLTINKATKIIGNGPHEKKTLLQKVDLKLQPGEFVTVVGGNGAGKSTLFNCISGSLPLTSGQILIDDQDVTQLSEEKRAAYLSRVFQDPKMGTAPRMTVAENLFWRNVVDRKGICICANYKHKKMFIINYVKKWATGSNNIWIHQQEIYLVGNAKH